MKFGYARVSTKEQNLDLQIDALKKEGCEQVFHEVVSGAKTKRAELGRLLASCLETRPIGAFSKTLGYTG